MHHYAAGLIDGEGYIGIQDSGGSFQVRLKIGMTDKGLPALNRMAAQYGGRVYKDREAKGNNRESHCWVTTGFKAAEIIRMVKPHLLVKADPARIALQLQNMLDTAEKHPNGRTVWTDEMRDKARYFREQIQYANRTGPDPTPVKYPDAKPFAKHRGGAWWEPDDSLFGPEPFEGKFPTAGRMVNGVAYELQTWEHRTGDTGYSSSPNDDDDQALLPTPTRQDGANNGGPSEFGRNPPPLNARVAMLPTPAASLVNDGEDVSQWDARRARIKATGVNGNGMGEPLTIAVQRLALLPAPSANIGDNGGSQDPAKRRAGGHQPSIQDVAEHKLLPTPRATDGTKGGPNQRGSSGDLMMPSAVHSPEWGNFAPAIERWERELGRPAPSPTVPDGRNGKHRLSAAFVEWMMGLPEGWVTDVPISRNEQLKALGNGVVPQQCTAALRDMLANTNAATAAA